MVLIKVSATFYGSAIDRQVVSGTAPFHGFHRKKINKKCPTPSCFAGVFRQ